MGAQEGQRRSQMPAHLVAHLGEVVSVVAADGTVLATNHELEDVSRAEGRDSLGFVHPEDRQQVADAFRALLEDPEARTRTLVRVRRGGEGTPYRWMETTGVNRIADPAVGGLVFVARDVEERVRTERLAQRALDAQRFVAALGLQVLREGRLEPALPGALAGLATLLGADSVALVEPDDAGVLRVTQQHAPAPLPPGSALPAAQDATGPGTVEQAPLLGPGGTRGALVAGWRGAHEVDDADRALLQGVANVLAGARSREEREEAAVVRALHDPLTGLPTRPLLLDRLDHALSRCTRDGEGSVAVLVVDLDAFKLVNDRYGHAAGDVLLAELGARLSRSVRPGDTAGRFGGDEFVVLCEDLPGAAGLAELRERVRGVFAQPFAVPEAGLLPVTGSIGVASSDVVGTDRSALLHAADLDMYRDKQERCPGSRS